MSRSITAERSVGGNASSAARSSVTRSWCSSCAYALGPGSKLVLDLSNVTYVDSATIGCLMDLYRQVNAAGGVLKLAGVQKRVETMLSMTGAHNFLEIHADEASAVRSFGS